MTSIYIRLKPFIIVILLLMTACFFKPSKILAATVVIQTEPSSGIAPLEVKLHCYVSYTTSVPKEYTIDFGDGSEIEKVLTNQYLHTFTHTYDNGFFKPICSVEKEDIGGLTESDPGKIIVAKWQFKTNGDIDSSPAIGPDDNVYVGSDDGNLYAINSETGNEIWHYSTGGGIQSSPAIDTNGTIYFGSLDNNFYAIKSNGTIKWSFNVGDYIFSSPAISIDGRIIVFGSSDNNIYALNAGSGTLKWTYETNGKIVSSPAIGHDGIGPVVYVGSLDRKVYALNLNNGNLKWVFHAEAEVYGSPAIGPDGKIYVGECETGDAVEYKFNLYCINIDGSKYWDFMGWTGFYSSPAIGPDYNIYVGSWDGYLYSVNSSGGFHWSFRTSPPRHINSSPAIASDSVVYAGSNDGNFYSFQSPEIEEKREDWVFKTGDIISSSPVIDAEGTIYFGSRDNCIYAINPGDKTAAGNSWSMFRGDRAHSGSTNNISIPAVISSHPGKNSDNVDINTSEIRINFSPEVEASQIDIDSFTLKKQTNDGQEAIVGFSTIKSVRYNDSGYNLTAVFEILNDEQALNYNTTYYASIDYTDNKMIDGEGTSEINDFESNYSFSFTTISQPIENSGSGSGGKPGCFIDSIH